MNKKRYRIFIFCCLLVAICMIGEISARAQGLFFEKPTIISNEVSSGEPVLAEPTGIPGEDANAVKNAYIVFEGLMEEVDGKLEPYTSSLTEEETRLIETIKDGQNE